MAMLLHGDEVVHESRRMPSTVLHVTLTEEADAATMTEEAGAA